MNANGISRIMVILNPVQNPFNPSFTAIDRMAETNEPCIPYNLTVQIICIIICKAEYLYYVVMLNCGKVQQGN